ncbi:alpha-acetolactate decarboxylase [Cyphellophora europaea CBS 101466]|uniref:Alpha-acetolactate decarboxylase n=1 Tax=Cyphellophora europaea (strain CBS 101466) TaxID=1220924 RepID=W2RR70_CYPE1|nr:alpha-acetolactate decarboxylase [Cyphellophora europaea CBS 101466]ETN38229.1 alpha-acetolactate decarboxylase [Cyphellophora europaea CBS 101466]
MSPVEPNHIYQYSLVNALMAGVSESGITTTQLLTKGNLGLGTFVRMDGELLLLDDKVYQLQSHGKIREAAAHDQIPYAVCTQFVPEHTLSVNLAHKDAVDRVLQDVNPDAENLFMAYRITGTFSHARCRTVKGQEYAGQPLAELGQSQFVAEYKDVEGTVVGFRSPRAWQGFFVAGEHLHFISDDRTFGGHVLELTAEQEVKFEVATVADVHIELPRTKTFNAAKMETDDMGLKSVEG